ncbi:putative NAD+ kinase, partial [Fasciolopsis buskii]
VCHTPTYLKISFLCLLILLQKWNVTVLLETRTIAELRKDERFLPVLDRYMLPTLSSVEERIKSSPTIESVCRTPLRLSEPPPCSVNFSNQEINEKSSIGAFENSHSIEVDLVVCLGGDGTLLNISSMFQHVVPPVLAFRLGSLGFLTPFPFHAFPSHLETTMTGACSHILAFKYFVLFRFALSESYLLFLFPM